jgi:hypothetical protein
VFSSWLCRLLIYPVKCQREHLIPGSKENEPFYQWVPRTDATRIQIRKPLHLAFFAESFQYLARKTVLWLFQQAENLKHINKKQLCSYGIAGKNSHREM